MTSGFCNLCHQLVQIKPKPVPLPPRVLFKADRRQEWYPTPHKNESGGMCKGSGMKI